MQRRPSGRGELELSAADDEAKGEHFHEEQDLHYHEHHIIQHTVINRTDLIQNKYELFAFGLAPPHFFLHYSTPTSLGITSIKHKDNDITLVDNFMQCTNVVSPHLFLRLLVWRG